MDEICPACQQPVPLREALVYGGRHEDCWAVPAAAVVAGTDHQPSKGARVPRNPKNAGGGNQVEKRKPNK